MSKYQQIAYTINMKIKLIYSLSKCDKNICARSFKKVYNYDFNYAHLSIMSTE